ncbi:MAG: C4-dicarboxylate-specific signal transduction histidine kinase, partial [Porticoccaceae bacterium]
MKVTNVLLQAALKRQLKSLKPRPGEQLMIVTNLKSSSRSILIAIFLLILLSALSASTWRALSINRSHTSIVNISKDIKYEIAVFHLWLEEYITGDETLDKASIWEHIKQSKTLSNTLLYGGEYGGKQIQLTLNEEIKKHLELALKEIEILDKLAQLRVASLQKNQPGSTADTEFDEQFHLIQTTLLRVDESISILIEYNIKKFMLLNSGTGIVILLFGLGLIIIFINKESERKAAAAQIIQATKLATLGEMATSVAHELNQPLNVIRMAAGNSRRRISKGTADPEYLNDKLKRIEEQTARAAAIIDH